MPISVPNLPYQPFGSVDPQGATPRLNVRADADAFGANIGRATERLGSEIGQAGKELFSRAMELQGYKNEAEVNEASTKFMEGAGQLQEKFQQLEGADPDKQLKAHTDALAKLRSDMRAGLSSPAVQRTFDNQTLSTMRSYNIRSSSYAATKLKQFNIDTAVAEGDTMERQAEQTPDLSDADFEDLMQRRIAKQDGITHAKFGTAAPEILKNEQDKVTSNMLIARAKGMAINDPVGAEKYLKDNQWRITGPGYTAAMAHISSGARNVTSRFSSGNVNDHPDGTGWWPGLPSEEKAIANSVPEQLTRPARKYMVENPDSDIKVLPGRPGSAPGREIGFEVSGDVNEVVKNMQRIAADGANPVNIEVDGNRIYMSYAPDAAVSTVPADEPQSEASRAAIASAHDAKLRSHDPNQESASIQRTMADYRRIENLRKNEDAARIHTLENAIYSQGPTGHYPRNEDDLRALGQNVINAFNGLTPKEQDKYRKKMTHEREVFDDSEARARLDGLIGTDPAAFISKVISDEPGLSPQHVPAYVAKQQQLTNKMETDPRLPRAVQMLRESGIWPTSLTKANNEAKWLTSNGLLRQELEEWQAANPGKQPKREDIEKMGRFLMQKDPAEEHWWPGGGAKPLWEKPVPPDVAKRIKEQAAAKGAIWNDQQVKTYFLRELYKELLSKGELK